MHNLIHQLKTNIAELNSLGAETTKIIEILNQIEELSKRVTELQKKTA